MDVRQHHTKTVKDIANKLGFDFCGISKAGKLEDEANRLENWLNKGYHGKMKWMEGHFDKRVDPTQLVPGAKSVISLLFNYRIHSGLCFFFKILNFFSCLVYPKIL